MSRVYFPRPLTSAALWAAALAVLACSSASDKSPAPPVLAPVLVHIADPSDNAMIPLATLIDGADYSLGYSTTNFTIAPPGECTGEPTPCGHGRIWVDGMACNDMDKSLAYNAEGASPISVGFDYCAKPIGPHDILIELHTDDGAAFVDPATGQLVTDSVHVAVTGADSAGGGGAGGGGAGGGGAGGGSGSAGSGGGGAGGEAGVP